MTQYDWWVAVEQKYDLVGGVAWEAVKQPIIRAKVKNWEPP